MQKKAQEYLKNYFGHKTFKKGQKAIIDSVLNKKDTIGIMPTGGGKSLCYQIPALCFDGLTIVISPLISLMKDQIDYLFSIKYPAEMLNSTVPFSRQINIKELVENKEIKLLYLTPERFKNENFLKWILSIKTSCFVIDEAHCISEWGHDFRPEYRQLSDLIEKLGRPPILALTATATEDVINDISFSLKMKKPTISTSGFNRENLIYGVQNHYSKEKKNKALIEFINKVDPPGIIYTASKTDAEIVNKILQTNTKKSVGIYHGGLPNKTRKKMQDDFLTDKVNILVATNAFGMGVDKRNIRYVIHYSIPGSIEAYYQETGRAGRDDKTSYCLLFAYENDKNIQEFFINASNPPLDNLLNIFKTIKKESARDLLYTEDIISFMDSKKYNIFIINNVLNQLSLMECLDFDYMTQEKIEINILKNSIDGENRDLLEEISSSSIQKNKFISLSLDSIKKRIGITEKELKSKLKELQEKKIISYKIIKRGKIVKIKKSEIPKNIKKEYENKIKRKIKIDREQFRSIIDYSDLDSCRRKFLLNYFGEQYLKDNCEKCDICRGTYNKDKQIEWNSIQKELLTFFVLYDGKIGKTKAIKILKGSFDIDPKYKNWDGYGKLDKYDTKDIEDEFYFLKRKDLLYIDNGKYAVVRLTNGSLKVIRDMHSSSRS